MCLIILVLLSRYGQMLALLQPSHHDKPSTQSKDITTLLKRVKNFLQKQQQHTNAGGINGAVKLSAIKLRAFFNCYRMVRSYNYIGKVPTDSAVEPLCNGHL